MFQKILDQLKLKYKGVSIKYLSGVASFLATTIKEESEIETAISGVDEMVQSHISSIDSEVSKGVESYKKKHTKKGKNEDDDDDDDPSKSEKVPAYVKKLMKQNEELMQFKTGYEAKQKTKGLKTSVMKALKEKGITEEDVKTFNLLGGVDLSDESKLDEIVEKVSTAHESNMQYLKTKGIGNVSPEFSNNMTDGEAAAKEVEALYSKKN